MSPTSSTLVTVKAQLVALFTTALATSSASGEQLLVLYGWQPDAEDEMVFLGRPSWLADEALYSGTARSNIASIKSGRQYRDEVYEVPLTVWSFRSDLGPEDQQECEQRALDLWAPCESVLADAPKLATAGLKDAQVVSWDLQTREHNGGLLSMVLPSIEVSARLT